MWAKHAQHAFCSQPLTDVSAFWQDLFYSFLTTRSFYFLRQFFERGILFCIRNYELSFSRGRFATIFFNYEISVSIRLFFSMIFFQSKVQVFFADVFRRFSERCEKASTKVQVDFPVYHISLIRFQPIYSFTQEYDLKLRPIPSWKSRVSRQGESHLVCVY